MKCSTCGQVIGQTLDEIRDHYSGRCGWGEEE